MALESAVFVECLLHELVMRAALITRQLTSFLMVFCFSNGKIVRLLPQNLILKDIIAGCNLDTVPFIYFNHDQDEPIYFHTLLYMPDQRCADKSRPLPATCG